MQGISAGFRNWVVQPSGGLSDGRSGSIEELTSIDLEERNKGEIGVGFRVFLHVCLYLGRVDFGEAIDDGE